MAHCLRFWYHDAKLTSGGMVHLSILMWIKVNYKQNTFIGLEFQILQYLTKKYNLKIFGKVKFLKAPVGFDLVTHSYVVNALINCTTLLGNNFGKENIYKVILDFIAYFDRKYVTKWRCPTPPKISSLPSRVVERVDRVLTEKDIFE